MPQPTSRLRRAVLFLAGACLMVGCHQTAQPPASPAATASSPSGASTSPARNGSTAAAPWNGFTPGPVLVGHTVKPSELTPSELKYGLAPQRMSGVVYQDNVILMEHGDQAIRSLNSNGMEWTLDANAPQVSQLATGQIVFATSRCVGKILSLQRNGNTVTLILGPIQLTDIIKQGNFSYDQPLDLNSMVAFSAPDYPGAVDSTASEQVEQQESPAKTSSAVHPSGNYRSVSYFIVSPAGEWRPMRTINRGGSAHISEASQFSLRRGSERDVALSDGVWRPSEDTNGMLLETQGVPVPGVPLTQFPKMPAGFGDIANDPPPPTVNMVNSMKMYACSLDCGGLGLKLYQEKSGVQIWIKAIFHLSAPRLVFHLSVNSSGVNAHVELAGAAGFTVGFDAVADKSLLANVHEVGAVPMDITIPLAGMGVPLTAMFQQSLSLNTAFSAKTSVLHSVGDFTAAGSITMDFVNGSWNIPPLQMTLKQNLASAVSGVSVGINSLAFAIDQRLLVGVGALGFASGPYVNLISSITALKQASEAPDCRQGTFGMQLGGGIGYAMPKVVAKVLNFFLGLVHIDPVPASGYIVRLKDNIPLVDLRDEIPPKCSG
jgi:hypothetical protein